MILGLIWTLILHYQISIGFGLEDQSKDGPSPKQALLNWINVSSMWHMDIHFHQSSWPDFINVDHSQKDLSTYKMS